MPRCSTHCPPPRSSGALLLAVIVAGVVIVAAAGDRDRAHADDSGDLRWHHCRTHHRWPGHGGGHCAAVETPRAEAGRPDVQARPPETRAIQATPATPPVLTSRRRQAAIGRQDDRGSGRYQVPATEQHLHLHLHGASGQELAHLLGQRRTPGGPES